MHRTSPGSVASHRSIQSVIRSKGWWSVPTIARTRGAADGSLTSEHAPDDLAAGVIALLLFPLQQEQVGDGVAEPTGQRRAVDPVEHLEVDGPNAQQPRGDEEREG